MGDKVKIYKSSLRDNLSINIRSFLTEEGFQIDENGIEGILGLVNLVSDYYEEGQHLYPEVVLTNDIGFFQSIPSYRLSIKTNERLSPISFKKAIKLCAPLTIDSWVIYIEIKSDHINFGVVSTEMAETGLSLYRQTLEPDLFDETTTYAYIRSLGPKVVEIKGLKTAIHVYLNLDEEKDLTEEKLSKLSHRIVETCSDNEDEREKLSIFFEKIIDQALKSGHGNLIGVVDDNEDSIKTIKTGLSDGTYLEDPIDMASLVLLAESEKTNKSSIKLKSYTTLMKSMLNHDGITLFSTSGKLLGYHLFIKDDKIDHGLVGGARSRAFEAMKRLGLKACFYKSQDGNIKYHE